MLNLVKNQFCFVLFQMEKEALINKLKRDLGLSTSQTTMQNGNPNSFSIINSMKHRSEASARYGSLEYITVILEDIQI